MSKIVYKALLIVIAGVAMLSLFSMKAHAIPLNPPTVEIMLDPNIFAGEPFDVQILARGIADDVFDDLIIDELAVTGFGFNTEMLGLSLTGPGITYGPGFIDNTADLASLGFDTDVAGWGDPEAVPPNVNGDVLLATMRLLAPSTGISGLRLYMDPTLYEMVPGETPLTAYDWGVEGLLITNLTKLHVFYQYEISAQRSITVGERVLVPEPGTIFLLGSGMVILAVLGRKRISSRIKGKK